MKNCEELCKEIFVPLIVLYGEGKVFKLCPDEEVIKYRTRLEVVRTGFLCFSLMNKKIWNEKGKSGSRPLTCRTVMRMMSWSVLCFGLVLNCCFLLRNCRPGVVNLVYMNTTLFCFIGIFKRVLYWIIMG